MEDRFEKIISKLDTATGMLIIPALKDQGIMDVMNIIQGVSIELGEMCDELISSK